MVKTHKLREGSKWSTYLINGEYYDRIPFRGEKVSSVCPTCFCKNKELHNLGCDQEWDCCGDHENGKAIDCFYEGYLE